MWDHSKISSGRFVAGVNETKSKIFLLKNIGYFRDICHKIFSNNACFAPDVVGFMIHILGLRIFPKSFGFFLGCSQQDLLEIVCERSLLRKATEICSRISLKNCLWIFPIHIIVSYSSRNYEVTPGVCPRPIPQELCLANLSLKTRVVVFATKKQYFQQSHKDIPPKSKNILGDIPQDNTFILKILCEGTLPNNL